jgi:hypothetical protein
VKDGSVLPTSVAIDKLTDFDWPVPFSGVHAILVELDHEDVAHTVPPTRNVWLMSTVAKFTPLTVTTP